MSNINLTSTVIDAAGGDPTARTRGMSLTALRALGRKQALAPLYSTVATAPTITQTSGSTSPLNTQFYGTPTFRWDSGNFTFLGRVAALAGSSNAFCVGLNTNYGNAANHPTVNGTNVNSDYMTVRFMTDAPVFEIVLRTGVPTWWDLWIDGYPLYRAGQKIIPLSSANFIKVDFGSDTMAYGGELVAITTPGTGHAVGDTVTMASGMQVIITGVSAGAVTSVQIINPGAYASPVTTTAQASTTGAGTGLVVTPTESIVSHTTRVLRRYELRIKGNGSYAFGGINFPVSPMKDILQPWPAVGPRMVALGDSITNDIFSDGPAMDWASIAAEYLGIEDIVTSGCPSQGWTVPIGGLTAGQRFSTDIFPLAPSDPSRAFVTVINMGYNDNAASTASIQAAVTTAVASYIANVPNGYLVVMGPWQGYLRSTNTTWAAMESAIQAGCLAAGGWNAKRHAFLPIVGKWIIPDDGKVTTSTSNNGNTSLYISQDGTHHGKALYKLTGGLVADALRNIFHNVWSL